MTFRAHGLMVEELSWDFEGTTDTLLEAHHLIQIELSSINITFEMFFFSQETPAYYWLILINSTDKLRIFYCSNCFKIYQNNIYIDSISPFISRYVAEK